MVSSKRFAVVAAAALALSAACTSTPVSAPNDGQIVMSANPSTIVLDEFAVPAVTQGSATITAQIFDLNGVPQPNVQVFFSTDGGTLDSSALPDNALKTDDNGRVSDVLNVALGDPAAITVTLRSGTLTGTQAVLVNEIAPNQPPFPVIDISPGGSAEFGDFVTFDGTISDDPDGDPITCYQWEIETGQNIAVAEIPCIPPSSRCEVAQGPTRLKVDRIYDGNDITDEQQIRVRLRLSDDPTIACPIGGPATPLADFNAETSAIYDIVCDRTAPSANAGANQTVNVGAGGQVSVSLSGAGSADPDSGISQYEWSCGNGTAPQTGVTTVCTYTNNGTTSVVFSATLTVTNGCLMTTVDAVTITVNP